MNILVEVVVDPMMLVAVWTLLTRRTIPENLDKKKS